MKIITAYEKHELEQLQPGVMVEMWRRVLTTGSGKRKFAAEFTEQERALIFEYYKTFARWHLKTGIPQLHQMKISTYHLMQRACNFFGTY